MSSLVLSCLAMAMCFSGPALGVLTRVTNFGTNPAGIQMYIDVPSNPALNPAIIVALHGCRGTAQNYYSSSNLPQLGAQKGFITIYPSSTHDLQCWDCGTSRSLKRDGGGDPQSIVQMVNYTIANYRTDASRVFVVGTSSGAMMGNVLAAIYPDVFAATSVYSGTAAGCMAVPDGVPPNPYDECGLGRIVRTPQQWGDLVRSYNPNYRGPWPRMQIWHGTSDTIVVYQNFIEELKEWSNVLGVSFARNVTNSPQSSYTQMVYGDGSRLVGYSALGVGHVVPIHTTQALQFFNL